MIFLFAYVLVGVAALHPAAGDLTGRTAPQPPRLSRTLLSLLTAASLIAPAILIVQVLAGRVTDGIAIAVGSSALFLLVVTRMAQLLREVELQARKVRDLARRDELTGLPNRRAWNDELPRALERARREGGPVSVALLDLDHFKRFNDSYGHPAGDRLLKESAAAWNSAIRPRTCSHATAARSSSCCCPAPVPATRLLSSSGRSRRPHWVRASPPV